MGLCLMPPEKLPSFFGQMIGLQMEQKSMTEPKYGIGDTVRLKVPEFIKIS